MKTINTPWSIVSGPDFADGCPVVPRKRRLALLGSAGLPGLLVALGICCVLVGIALPHIRKTNESASEIKLQQDVAALNRAVRTFEVMGGSVKGLSAPDEVLSRLKSGMSAESRQRLLGVRGAVVDERMEAVMQVTDEAGGTGLRAIWDSEEGAFVMRSAGAPGVKEFRLGKELSPQLAAVDRKRYLDAGTVSGWVWDFNETPVRGKTPGVQLTGSVEQPVLADLNGETAPVGPGLVMESTAWGYFLSADLGVAGIPLSTGEVGVTRRTGSSPFVVTHSVNQSVDLPVLGLVKVLDVDGTVLSGASSDVDGQPGNRYATGVGEATSIVLKLVQLPAVLFIAPPPVLELRAQVLRSSATVAGGYGSLDVSGMSTVTGLQVKIMGGGLVDLAVTGEENQTIGLDLLGLAGVKLVVNETHHGTAAAGDRSTQRAALHVQVAALNVAGLGLVTGDIHVGRAGANLKALASLD